jgi:formate dehydrogenase major subunit
MMNAVSQPLQVVPTVSAEPIQFLLNGQTVSGAADETLIQIAKRNGVEIAHLCYKEGMRADGNCRACVVEIKGERTLAPSCCRHPSAGMEVSTASPRALTAQRMVLELLQSDMPAASGPAAGDQLGYKRNNELAHWSQQLGVTQSRFSRRVQPAADFSHPAMSVNLDACIQCTRCVRACREVQVNDVIGLAFRGSEAKIVFDLDDPMGASSCVACGECVQACPTGALAPAKNVAMVEPERSVDSLCPYCGVGCQVSYKVKDEKIIRVEGRDGPANLSRLCVKGRFGFDYIHNAERLTTPLIRKADYPKSADFDSLPANRRDMFREASWEEALDLAAASLKRIRDEVGPSALAGFGSAKGSNEEAYLFQKLVRTGFRTNNVDHCTRLCHAASVAALLEGLGSGAVSNPVMDVEHAELIFVIGANPVSNHPVAATWMKNAVKRGAKLILADPRKSELARHAWRYLQFKPDTDVALLNAMMHVIIAEGLTDPAFIADRTSGFDLIRDNVAACTPESMAPICGIDAEVIRTVARAYATSKASMMLWGMGVSQHTHGTDNARCLIALAMITGQIGRPGTGLHPLRGQNNVQGASDVGLIPMMYPDYQRVDNPAAQQRFEALWHTKLDNKPGLTVVEVMHAAKRREIRGMAIMGENPAMSDPDLQHARQALASLDVLVVQEIFLTETAWLADIILPATAFPEKTGTFTNTDRCVQMGRQVLRPPGDAKPDLWIICELARRLGLDWHYDHPRDIFNEMRQGMNSIAGITWERLEAEGAVVYPCPVEGGVSQPIVFHDSFPTASGRARLVPAQFMHAKEVPDAEYPFVLITGRQLEHWHTGAMTRRATVLDAIEPQATVSMHPADMANLNVKAGQMIKVQSRRGEIALAVRRDEGTPQGGVFIPFAYVEAAANLLTNSDLDPFGKIPGVKYCAVRLAAA